MPSDFEQTQEFQQGRAGESSIAMWFRDKGYSVLPIYEKILDEYKGPTLFLPKEVRIAPDMFVFNASRALWIEAKHKTGFAWYRKTQQWTTGIDLKHYGDYCAVDDSTPWPVYLMFLHKGGCAKDSGQSPAGLFGEKLSILRQCENHRCPATQMGSSGMVFWDIDHLRKWADISAFKTEAH
jgi:hypothetical protein